MGNHVPMVFGVLLVHVVMATIYAFQLDLCSQNWTIYDFDDLLQISHCRVLYGNLEIISLNFSYLPALIEPAKFTEKEKNLISKSFELQVEDLHGYLLLANVYGLRSLAMILPKLTLIRGRQLWSPAPARLYADDSVEHVLTLQRPAYSLVIYSTELTELGLHRLSMIGRGDVHILDNEQLCLNTINWETLVPHYWKDEQFRLIPHTAAGWQSVFMRRNAPHFLCLTKEYCPKNCPNGCWNASLCQPTSQKDCVSWQQREATSASAYASMMSTRQSCCDAECLIDCNGPGADECRFCRRFRRGKFCVASCAPHEVLIQDECAERDRCSNDSVIHEKKCLSQCPSNLCLNHTTRECVACTVCTRTHIFLRTMDRAAELRDCRVLDGNVTMSFDSPHQSLLATYLGQVEVITGFLLVQNSMLESLDFMRSLRTIGGDGGPLVNWSVRILNNDKMKTLWNARTHPPVRIERGFIEIRGNKHLCFEMRASFVAKTSDKRIEYYTDDLKEKCNKNLQLSVEIFGSNSITVRLNDSFSKTKHDDATMTYYYEASYRPLRNGSRAFTDDGVWSKKKFDPYSTLLYIRNLEAYVTYAIYAERFSITHGYARSDVIYQRTGSAAPSRPFVPENSEFRSTTVNSMTIRWQPPIRSHGVIKRYLIQYKEQARVLEKLEQCSSQVNQSIKTAVLRQVPTESVCTVDRSNLTMWSESGRRLFNDSTFRPLIDRLVALVSAEQLLSAQVAAERTELMNSQIAGEVEYIDYFLGKEHVNNYPRSEKRYASKNNTGANKTEAIQQLLVDIMNWTRRKPKAQLSWTLNIPPTVTLPEDNGPDLLFSPNDSSIITVELPHRLIATINGLKRFTIYDVYIYACQDPEGSNVTTKLRKLCSGPAHVSISTDGVSSFDEVNASSISLRHSSKPDYYLISWQRPAAPNGDVVVRYYVELSVGETVIAKYCVNGDDLHQAVHSLQNEFKIEPGEYGVRIQAVSRYGYSNWTAKRVFVFEPSHESNSVLITLFSTGVISSLVLLSALLICLRMHRRNKREKSARTSINPDYMVFTYRADEWELEREQIRITHELGQGSFGMVYEGLYDNGTANPRRVAVKTSCANSLRERMEFLKEASRMKEFTGCKHIVQLIGVVSRLSPELVVMELMENGDLKGFLRRHRPDAANPIGRPPPSHQQRVQIAAQIADGMAFLSTHKFVHRDLAARNCMVHADFTVKIGDFGLSRDVYETDYYRPAQAGPLPVRWMAPEAIRDGLFDTKTDVWSFGVVLWEIAELAAQPYAGLSNEQVAKAVVDGIRLTRPADCTDFFYKLMLRCWRYKPRDRPDFTNILDDLEHEVSYRFRTNSWYFINRSTLRLRSKTSITLVGDTDQNDSLDLENNEPELDATSQITVTYQLPAEQQAPSS